MSVLAIDKQTFKQLAHTLGGIDYTGNGSKYQHVGHELVNNGNLYGFSWEQGQTVNPNNREYDGLHRFFGYLWAMNHRAYRNAYAHIDKFEYERYGAPMGHGDPRMDIYQVLKSLHCIKYNIDAESPILNKLTDLVTFSIIDNLPEYNAANWG